MPSAKKLAKRNRHRPAPPPSSATTQAATARRHWVHEVADALVAKGGASRRRDALTVKACDGCAAAIACARAKLAAPRPDGSVPMPEEDCHFVLVHQEDEAVAFIRRPAAAHWSRETSAATRDQTERRVETYIMDSFAFYLLAIVPSAALEDGGRDGTYTLLVMVSKLVLAWIRHRYDLCDDEAALFKLGRIARKRALCSEGVTLGDVRLGWTCVLQVDSMILETAEPEGCGHCGKVGEGMHRCNGCRAAMYCGRACQKKAWGDHKENCKLRRIVLNSMYPSFVIKWVDPGRKIKGGTVTVYSGHEIIKSE